MSWLREFDEPIQTPDGKQLRTLREAVAYLAKTVPKSERDVPAVTTAAEMLTNAAERADRMDVLCTRGDAKGHPPPRGAKRTELPRP